MSVQEIAASKTTRNIGATVYMDADRPIAIVLWPTHSDPSDAFCFTRDGTLMKFEASAARPEFHYEKIESYRGIDADIKHDTGQITDVRIIHHHTGQVLAHLQGLSTPEPRFAFNDPAQGIFECSYRDRFGAPVRDTFAALLRSAIYGSAPLVIGDGKNTRAMTARLVAQFSSPQLEALDALVHERQSTLDDIAVEKSVLQWLRENAKPKWLEVMLESHEIRQGSLVEWVKTQYSEAFDSASGEQQAKWADEYLKAQDAVVANDHDFSPELTM